MKTRVGFVSNSSSTSFCIFGTLIDEELLAEKLMDFKPGVSKIPNCHHKIDREKVKYCPECGKASYKEVKIETPSDEDLEDACSSIGLDLYRIDEGCEDEGLYVGINIKERGSDDKILEKLKDAETFIDNKFGYKCRFFSGSYYS